MTAITIADKFVLSLFCLDYGKLTFRGYQIVNTFYFAAFDAPLFNERFAAW